MTEEEWLAATDPTPMLESQKGKASDRKLRLLSTSCFQRLSRLLPALEQQQGIYVLEQLADGDIARNGCGNLVADLRHAIPRDERNQFPFDDPHFVALMLYREFCSSSVAVHAITATAGLADGAAEQLVQASMMRDSLGNPFRPVTLDPSWLSSTAICIAQGIYDDKAFDRLPILADALQDAGCENADILNHLRSDGPHVKGCWALDLVLGKE